MYLNSDKIVPQKSSGILLQITQGLREHITKHAKAFKGIPGALASEIVQYEPECDPVHLTASVMVKLSH